ncbi:MAG: hypothetical protein AAGA99_00970 [Actinomycetota bacterium]
MQIITRPLAAILTAAVLVLAACGDDEADDAAVAAATSTSTTGAGAGDAAAEVTSTTAPPTTSPPTTTTEATDEPIELTVGVPFGVVQLAALGGLSTDAELAAVATVEELPITAPDQLRTGFVAGDLDVAIVPTNIAATLFTRGVDVRILSIVDAQLLQVLGPAGSSWSDLAGAVVDIPFPGDIADLVFSDLASRNGVDLASVDVRYGTALPDLVGAAASGNVTFAVLPEHFATAAVGQAMANGHDLAPIIDLQVAWGDATGGDRLPQVALIATGAVVDEHPAVIEALRSSVASSISTVTSDTEAAATTLADATGLPMPLLSALLPQLDLATRSSVEARADLDLLFAGLVELTPEAVGGALPDDTLFAP